MATSVGSRAKQRADDLKRLLAHDPEALQQMQASAQAAKAARRTARIDTWLAGHPYAAEVLAATGPHPSNPNGDTQIGLDGSDPRDYQETWKWGQQENEVVNPGGFQGGSPMYEEYAARLYARHNRGFFPGDPITAGEEDDIERSNAQATCDQRPGLRTASAPRGLRSSTGRRNGEDGSGQRHRARWR